MSIEAMKQMVEALEEIALAGMSGTGQESDEAMIEWHARQAWNFISIAARQLEPLRQAIATEQSSATQEPYGWVSDGNFYKVQQFRLEGGAYEDQVAVYTHPPVPQGHKPKADVPTSLNAATQLDQTSCYCPNCEALSKKLAEQEPKREPLTDEQTHEAIGTAGIDLLELAKLWSDNKIHVYQFDNEARKIIKAVLLRAHGIKGAA